MTIEELRAEGPPLTLRDLEALSGLSRITIRREIESKELRAARRRSGRNTHYRVARSEARRWLVRLGYQIPRAVGLAR